MVIVQPRISISKVARVGRSPAPSMWWNVSIAAMRSRWMVPHAQSRGRECARFVQAQATLRKRTRCRWSWMSVS